MELPLKMFLAKVNNFKFTYMVPSDPDSFLCLPVVSRCYLKALKCPLGQIEHILLMQSRQMCGYLNLFLTCFYHHLIMFLLWDEGVFFCLWYCYSTVKTDIIGLVINTINGLHVIYFYLSIFISLLLQCILL